MALPQSISTSDALAGKPNSYAMTDARGAVLFNRYLQDGVSLGTAGVGCLGPLPSDYNLCGLWVGKGVANTPDISSTNYHMLFGGADAAAFQYIWLNAPSSGGQILQKINNVTVGTLTSAGYAVAGTLSSVGSLSVGNPANLSLVVNPATGVMSWKSGGFGELQLNGANGGALRFQTNGSGSWALFTGFDAETTLTFYNTRTTVRALKLDSSSNATFAAGVAIGGGALIQKVLTATGTLDFPDTPAQTSADLTLTVAGAAAGDAVFLSVPASPAANTSFTAWVSAADTVTVRHNNYSAGAVNPASGTYRAVVFKF